MSTRVYLGIGSNVAPTDNVTKALQRVGDAIGIVALSTFFATPALERPADPPFVNAVAEVGAGVSPAALKSTLREIERACGRQRGPDRFGPRSIDLDLLLYGDLVSSSPDLPLPHPDVTRRRFVALPLLELAPDLTIPGSGARLDAIARSLPPHPMEPLVQLTHELRRRYVTGGHRQG